MKKIIIGLLLLLGVAYVALSYYFSSLVLDAPRRSAAETRMHIQERAGIDILDYRQKLPEGEDFTVHSRVDDLILKGSYFKQDTSRCAVLIAHGYGSTRISMTKYAPIFWECGCDIALFDFRGHGESGEAYATGGTHEAEDLQSVSAWLKEKTGLSDEYIGWMGSSWGGAAVLQAGASDDDVAFIIANAPFESWETAVFERAEITYGSWIGLLQPGVWAMASLRTGTNAWNASALKAAPKIVEPVLILHSQNDQATNSQQSVHIADKLDPDKHRFHHHNWGAAHGNSLYTRPEEYRQYVLDFIYDFVPTWKPIMECRE